MSHNLGGFIGEYKPTAEISSGVYTLQDVYNQVAKSSWPGSPSLEFASPYTTGYSDGYWDSSAKQGFWNSGKGLIVSSEDIFTESTRKWDTTNTTTGFKSQTTSTLFSSIPSSLWWVYAIVIGGGGGGNGSGNGDGGSGGGWAWAKLDLRNYVGSSLTCISAAGGNINANGGSSSLSISGTTIMSASGGTTYVNGSGGGSGSVTSHASVVRSLNLTGGSGADNAAGGNGGTGGGGGGPTTSTGGTAQRPFGGAGSGGDGGGYAPGGSNNTSYSDAIYKDPDRNNAVWITQAKAYSAISALAYFTAASASTWNDGRDGRPSSYSNHGAGTFGNGGGGSGSGSGYAGGPGTVVLWWD